MHHHPEHPWTVASLAAACGVSRAAFARRFTEVVGEPPLSFLTGWRLALAADLLAAPDATLGVGGGPGGLRQRVRAERGVQAGARPVADGVPQVGGGGMKKIGFLSFGHWTPSPQSQTRSASDALLQSIELAVAAEELGADGAYFRVHHFARQLASPFPLLAAIGARTSRIEIGTGVIDMRYENPLYMAEDAGRGRPDLRRPAAAGHQPRVTGAGDRRLPLLRLRPRRGLRPRGHGPRAHPRVPQGAHRRGVRPAQPAADVPEPARPAPDRAALAGAARPDLVGRRIPRDRRVDRGAGHEPDELDAAHRGHRGAVPPAPGRTDPAVPGRLEGRRPRSGSRGSRSAAASSRSSATWTGRTSAARPAARTRSATWTAAWPASARRTPGSRTSWSRISPRTRRSRPPTPCCSPFPNQLGVDYNAHLLESVVRHVAPELGWR